MNIKSSKHWNFRKLPSALDFQWIMAKTLPRYQWTASAGLFAGPVFFNASLSTSPFSGKIFDSKLKAYCVSISVDVPYYYAKFAGGIMERNALDNVKSFFRHGRNFHGK